PSSWRQTRLQALVQRVEHGAVCLRLCAGGGDGLGSLPHFRSARRDEVVHPAHSGIDHPDADLDETKPLRREVGGLAINEPRAKDAEQAQADEQHGKRNGGNANCLLEDWHSWFRCSFQVKAWLIPNDQWAGLPRLFLRENSALFAFP